MSPSPGNLILPLAQAFIAVIMKLIECRRMALVI